MSGIKANRVAPVHGDLANAPDAQRLQRGSVGLIGVLFLTVTGAAPLTAMLGNVPFAVGFGNGIHVPAAFLMATILLTIFSVGYAAMASNVSSVGGFYAFISLGLGRTIGLSAGLASLAASLHWRPIACLKPRWRASLHFFPTR